MGLLLRLYVELPALAATKHYLDTYFEHNLGQPSFSWDKALTQPLRCRVPPAGNGTIGCAPLLPGAPDLRFDYPTFNPEWKMVPTYRWMYAIAAASTSTSRWFDEAVKVDMHTGTVSRRWSAPNVFLAEFDFAPASASVAADDEDDGLLLTVLYNATSDVSSYGVFDAKTLQPLAILPLGAAVPFHAHGIVCSGGSGGSKQRCFSNP